MYVHAESESKALPSIGYASFVSALRSQAGPPIRVAAGAAMSRRESAVPRPTRKSNRNTIV